MIGWLPVQRLSTPRSIIAWAYQLVLAAMFLAAAVAKLAGAPIWVQIFDQIGLGQWFRIVTGVVEIVGAVALLVPGFAAFGALWLGTTMVFAILMHLIVLHTSPVPAALLLVLNLVVVWIRYGQLAALLARFLFDHRA